MHCLSFTGAFESGEVHGEVEINVRQHARWVLLGVLPRLGAFGGVWDWVMVLGRVWGVEVGGSGNFRHSKHTQRV